MNDEDVRLLAMLNDRQQLTEGDDDLLQGVEDDEGLLGGNTAGYDDQTEGDEDDTAGDDEETGAIKRLIGQVDPTKLSRSGLSAAMALAARSKRKKRGKIITTARPQPANAVKARRSALTNYRAAFPGEVKVTRGFYYGSMFFEFKGEGNADYGLISLTNGAQCFDKYIGETVTLFPDSGYPVNITLTEAETNVAKLGNNSYPKQKFLIEGVQMTVRAIRVRFNETLVAASGLPGTVLEMLRGQIPIFDEDGVVVPQGFFHDFSGRLELYRALAANGVLKIATTYTKVGNNKRSEEIVIDTLTNLPTVGREPNRELAVLTSGGSTLPHNDKGILWNLDQSDKDAMTLTAGVDLKRKFALAFNCVRSTGHATNKVHPEQVSIQVECRFNGTSFTPRDAKSR